jgi:hypothetical protein
MRRGQKGRRVIGKAFGYHLDVLGRISHHRQIDFISGHAAHNLFFVGHLQFQFHAGMRIHKIDQNMRQPVFGGGHRAYAQSA